jgi:hypothetical protein
MLFMLDCIYDQLFRRLLWLEGLAGILRDERTVDIWQETIGLTIDALEGIDNLYIRLIQFNEGQADQKHVSPAQRTTMLKH